MTSMTNPKTPCKSQAIEAQDLANFILDVGVTLMSSGAHCGRVWRNCKRIAEHWGFDLQFNPNFTGLLVNVQDLQNKANMATCYRTSPPHNVHFEKITLISHLSWQISSGALSLEQAQKKFADIQSVKPYNHHLVTLAIGVACACLCLIAGGGWMDAAFVFVASSLGAIVRYFMLRKKFNSFLSFIFASIVTTLISGINTLLGNGETSQIAMATAVLYLVPGVPLINSVIDLLEGYLQSSLARSLFAASILCSIATGMTIGILLLGIKNF